MRSIKAALARACRWMLERVTDPEPELDEGHARTRAGEIIPELVLSRLREGWKRSEG